MISMAGQQTNTHTYTDLLTFLNVCVCMRDSLLSMNPFVLFPWIHLYFSHVSYLCPFNSSICNHCRL